MSKLEEFKVDESKVWFGEYWPEGVPKQIYEVEVLSLNRCLMDFRDVLPKVTFGIKMYVWRCSGPT